MRSRSTRAGSDAGGVPSTIKHWPSASFEGSRTASCPTWRRAQPSEAPT